MYISVIGAGQCDETLGRLAYEVGREIAAQGHILVCGGLGGVMDAAAHGASDAGGVSVGILPYPDRTYASKWLTVSIPTDMGHARNAIVVLSGNVVIAVGGGYGTLSEISFGLKMSKPVVGLETWELPERKPGARKIVRASDPAEAVALAVELASGGGKGLPG